MIQDLRGWGGNDGYAPSEKENKYTNEDLKVMQGWSLDRKIQVTQTRIIEWYKKWDGKVFVSFSGGKDSTVLADLAAGVVKATGYKFILWYSDTGLEYPEVREHVKQFPQYLKEKHQIDVELIMDAPRDKNGKRITFKDIIQTKGYPVISKEISRDISIAKNKPDGKTAQKFIRNSDYHKKYGDRWLLERWVFLMDAPFKTSNQCCKIMKERPSYKFQKETEMYPMTGTMACESDRRKTNWLMNGCNMFNIKHPVSNPLSFWTQQDILQYLVKFNVPYSSAYGEILLNDKNQYYTTGLDRTGCFACMFGVHLEKEPNRFQRLKVTHPKLWEYCMKPWDEGGLGEKEVLDFINVKTE